MEVKARALVCSLLFRETGGLFSLNTFTMRCVSSAAQTKHRECTPWVSYMLPWIMLRAPNQNEDAVFFAPPAARERWEPTGVVFSRMLSQHTHYWQWYYALEKSLIKVESAHWYQYCTRLIDNSRRPGLEVKDMDSQLIAMRLNWKLILLGKKTCVILQKFIKDI